LQFAHIETPKPNQQKTERFGGLYASTNDAPMEEVD
jgi:hypothetical protein